MPAPLRFAAVSSACFLALAAALHAVDDIVIADFEGAGYGAWTTTGGAFGTAPARGTLPGQMKVEGFAGHGLANSFVGGDRSVGTLTSPEFVLNRAHLSFLIGGGGFAGETCLNLLIDGKVVRTAVGPNTAPGGSETLGPDSWDVREFAGKTARIEIVDRATGGWGHINVDQIVLTDRRPPRVLENVSREIVCDRTYLNLPVKNGAKKRRMRFSVDGTTAREFEIELADGAAPDFWVFLDLTPFRGKKATVSVDRLAEDSTALASLEVSDEIRDAANLYREPLRPQFHFSSRRGWLNDPNGLVFHAGEYHLYYQHNPYGWPWGNMHWGHAVSSDLVHWRELPIALYPHRYNDWAFSGSAVVDRENTGGWKRGSEDVLVAAYTSTGRGECIVFSHDRGRTWTEFEGNPVVKHNGRDPRLLWHAPTRSWVMATYTEDPATPGNGKVQDIAFYTSPDLKRWTYRSRLSGFFECPDLFELPVDGDPQRTKWVLSAANSEYVIGTFDGREFQRETPKLPGHRGEKYYAAQTFTNEPKGRVVQIGWAQIEMPGMPFNQMMSVPCELTLRTTPAGVRLCFQPVPEIETLRTAVRSLVAPKLAAGEHAVENVTGGLFDIVASFEPRTAAAVEFVVNGVAISYDAQRQELVSGKHRAPLLPVAGKIELRILADRGLIEVFGNEGSVFMPLPAPAAAPGVRVKVRDGEAQNVAVRVHELRSIWGK